MKIELVRGDITLQDVDAIVNAANSALRRGSGVCGAIHSAAGDELQAACNLLDGCDVGHAKSTPGFKLPAKWVIHAVGPVWHGGASGEADLLASCYRSSLFEADRIGAASVAFPAISAGIFGYPIDRACAIAASTVSAASTQVELVRFVVFDEENEQAYNARLGI